MGQGASIVNKAVVESSPSKEDCRNLPFRTQEGVNPNCRWPTVLHCFQPFHQAKINICENSISYCGVIKIGPAEVGSAEISSSEDGPAEVSPAEISSSQISTP